FAQQFACPRFGQRPAPCFVARLLQRARHLHCFALSGQPRRFLDPPTERVGVTGVPEGRPQLPVSFRFISDHTWHVVTYVVTFQEVNGVSQSLFTWERGEAASLGVESPLRVRGKQSGFHRIAQRNFPSSRWVAAANLVRLI